MTTKRPTTFGTNESSLKTVNDLCLTLFVVKQKYINGFEQNLFQTAK